MIDQPPSNPSPSNDDWEDQSSQRWFYKWGLGIVLPAVLLILAIIGLWNGQMWMSDKNGATLKLTGMNAGFGAAGLLGLSLFTQCHYYWGNVYNQFWAAVLGKIAGLACFIVATFAVLIRVGVLNRH